MANHYPYNSGVSAATIEITPPNSFPERWLRAYGSLDHPNMLGGLCGLGILIAVYLFINLYQNNYSRAKEIGLSLMIILATVGLFLSFSRAAIIAMALGLIIIIASRPRAWRRALLSILFIAATGLILFFNYGQLYHNRLEPLQGVASQSIDDRATYFQESMTIIKKHPLFGVGAGNYGLALVQQFPDKPNSYYYQPVHNVFLFIWSEIGVLGLALWLILLFKLLLDGLKTIKISAESGLAVAGLSLVIALMFFDHWLWSLHFGLMFFWLIVGLVLKIFLANKKPSA